MESTAMSQKDSTVSLGDITFRPPTSDTSFYSLSSEEAAFFKTQIGIDNDEDLKRHILEVQAKAYKVAPYPCIYAFSFLRLDISTYPVYEHVLKLGRERPDAVLLDIGCCFGVDARKAAADGFPVEHIIASDINKEFLELSHELFNTTQASYAGHFLPGDVFDPAFLRIAERSDDISSAPGIDLTSLKSLNPLHGRVSAIYASKFFHMFSEDKQSHLARAVASLLSAEPGSVIFGDQIGALETGIIVANIQGSEPQCFAHSPETWCSLWDGEVFEKGSVKVEVDLMEKVIFEERCLVMRWSVVRL